MSHELTTPKNRSFKYVMTHLKNHPHAHKCVFQARPNKFKFGVLNYGEIKYWVNTADGDPWDVFAPTHVKIQTNTPCKISEVIGVLILQNGNHKIAVRIDGVPYDAKSEKQYIDTFCKGYCEFTRIPGKFMYL